jgi:glutamate 5-kinase
LKHKLSSDTFFPQQFPNILNHPTTNLSLYFSAPYKTRFKIQKKNNEVFSANRMQNHQQQQPHRKGKTVVLKIGSNSLVEPGTWNLNERFLDGVAGQVAHLIQAENCRVVIVTSGAVATGVSALGLKERPPGMAQRQALASIGQVGVIAQWTRSLSAHGVQCAQLLLSHGDFADRERSHNLSATLRVLFDWCVVPIVNENDPVATAELSVGDNDKMSALVAIHVQADYLLLLTDVDGVFDRNPRQDPTAQRTPEITQVSLEMLTAADGPGSGKGRGGMRSKLESARLASAAGVSIRIASAAFPQVITRSVVSPASRDFGTVIAAQRSTFISEKKRWLGIQRCPGTLTIDSGAVRALQAKHSLLFVGIKSLTGEFSVGDTVSIADEAGLEVARGIVSVCSADMALAAGRRTGEVEAVLGVHYDSAVDRDDILLLATTSTTQIAAVV